MRSYRRAQQGFSLIETVIALGILGLVGMAFMMTLNTGSRSTGILDDEVQASALGRSQLEDVKNAAYNTSSGCYPNDCYSVTVTVPEGFSVGVRTDRLDSTANNALQKITVAVSHQGKPLLALATYKKK